MSEERGIKWKTLRIQGLRQRWVFNSIMPVLLMLVLLVTLFSVGISSYYYGTMQDGLMKQARAEAGAFNDYFMDNGFAEYLQRATQSTTNFEDKDRIELQFINGAGRIQVSSTSSLKNGIKPGTPDIEQAIAQQDCVAFQGRDPETGENILAVSAPLMYSGKVVGVLRLVTSLREVNRQILVTIAVVLVIAALCMTMVILANLLFINDVVEPVAVVTDAAKRISAGGYGIQIENKYSDELGELVDNINDMSLKIGRNEKMKREEGIALEYESCDEEMPFISGDPERLKQVFCNVLDNAAKHGGSGLRITASICREGHEEVVRVRDYGPGIPEAELPYVKQKFYKGSSKARGSGIGLAVCDEIIGLHGGTFTIGNAEGGGAVVTIRLPMNE